MTKLEQLLIKKTMTKQSKKSTVTPTIKTSKSKSNANVKAIPFPKGKPTQYPK